MNPKISLIAAIGKNRELGKDNKLLFNLPEDMKRFRTLTSGHPVIMGRKTFESIGRLLPGRNNIVITRDTNFTREGLGVCGSIGEAIERAKEGLGSDEIFIIGGAQIYSLGMPYADKLYLTIVDKEVSNADAFFPDYSEFKKVVSEKESEENGLHYKFIDLVR